MAQELVRLYMARDARGDWAVLDYNPATREMVYVEVGHGLGGPKEYSPKVGDSFLYTADEEPWEDGPLREMEIVDSASQEVIGDFSIFPPIYAKAIAGGSPGPAYGPDPMDVVFRGLLS